ncbi:hypothetical protein FHS21_001334 [Phyllobacterium trifolii]|uniref:Uncharacterized protein n=1 Tax=Phyllobacterium trifolii TaxID=300193 RepID=A0A839U4R6_9HYPH|nr:hypothetical protein [Phyllobacterium trifolii]
MTTFTETFVHFSDQPTGRFCTVTMNALKLPVAKVIFIDPPVPDETEADERARVLEIAKSLFSEAASSL